MTGRRGFKVAAVVGAVAWLLTTVFAGVVAVTGIAGLAGWADDFDSHVRLVPGTDLLSVDVHPSWGAVGGGEVCRPITVRDDATDCYSLLLTRDEPRYDGDEVRQGPVRPVSVSLEGEVLLDADPGWNPLIAAIYAMTVVGILVISYVLFQLWRLLRAAGTGRPFTAQVVRRLRRMGLVLVAWEIVEPVLWLVLSPKALDYTESYYGPVPSIQLGSMEPGGPQLTVIAFGLLLVLMAEVFRYGSILQDEQEMTV